VKLLLVNSAAPELWGGGEKWFIEAAKWFAGQGHDVVVCARTGSRFETAARETDLNKVSTPFGGDFDPFAIARAHKILSDVKPQVVLTNFNKEAWHFGLARDRMETRLIARHGFPLWDNKLHHKLLARLLDHLIVNAEPIRERYLALGVPDQKISVVHNGVSQVSQRSGELRKRLSLPEVAFLAVAAGRLEQQKRFDLLLQTWKSALRDDSARIVIFGRGPQEETLKLLARELQIEKSVAFAGFDEEFASLVGDADLFLLTSENEGTPNAVLEAMSAGVPVLGFDVGAMKSLLRDNLSRFLIRAGDAAMFAERLSRWIQNREELRSCRAKFAERARNEFGLDASMRHYEAVFRALVARNART
jgi:glycosyltransferase involved in cell wall biosynthesis